MKHNMKEATWQTLLSKIDWWYQKMKTICDDFYFIA